MIRPILKYPDPFLKQEAAQVVEVNDWVRELARDMIETMLAAGGIGLAAPQIGVPGRVIVVMVKQSSSHPSVPLVMIDPEIMSEVGTQKGGEGCLSFPNVFEQVSRPQEIQVSYTDLEGEPQICIMMDLEARCVAHEIDHLNGRLFIERMTPVRRALVQKNIRRLVG